MSIPRRAALVIAMLTVAFLCHAASALAHPVPRSVPAAPELTFRPGPLRLYHDERSDAWYWYFTYEVVNRTGRDQIWAPSLVLFTDGGQIMGSGKNVPLTVSRSIKKLLGDDLLETQNEIIGDLLQGETNARSGLAVWPAPDTSATELSLFIAGLSTETAVVEHPVTSEEIILRKTLQRDYLVPGDWRATPSLPVELHPERDPRWIMR